MGNSTRGVCECGAPAGRGCCHVHSLVSVDSRGQMVLPKDLRERAGIKAGDQLAVVTWQRGGRVGCISLLRAGELGGIVRDLMGPMVKDITVARKGRRAR